MLYFFNAPLQLFLNFMPDYSYFSMIFFRSHSTVSIYWLPNANKRKTTCGFHEPKSLCKFIILLYFLYFIVFIVFYCKFIIILYTHLSKEKVIPSFSPSLPATTLSNHICL